MPKTDKAAEIAAADAKALAHQQACLAPILANTEKVLAGIRQLGDRLEAEIVKAEGKQPKPKKKARKRGHTRRD